jgi:putative glycosyltransferase (TIGR04372 family)
MAMVSAKSDSHEPDTESRPVIIVALLLATTLGDFIEYNLFAASFKRRYRHARLIAYYRRDRSFKDAVVEMNQDIDEIWPQDDAETVTAGYFNVMPGGDSDRHADIILTPSMMDRTRLPAFPALARFNVPLGKVEACEQALLDGGLDPNRWYCVLHYREPTYEERGANADRDIEPDDPIAMTRYIIDALGGQVVRVGHPEMAAFPNIAGFVDLSRGPPDIQIQAAAVRRSRFFLELSPSGPMALALCFGVPVARCNALILAGPTSTNSIVLNQHLIGPDGNTIPIDVCIEKNLLNGAVMPHKLRERGFRFRRNSLVEMKAVARDMVEMTTGHKAWRTPEQTGGADSPDQFSWPMTPVRRHHIVGHTPTTSPSATGEA